MMKSVSFFLDGKEDNTGVVDNKHNLKNDRYQIAGGSCVPVIGNLGVDTDIMSQAGVQEEAYRMKDFACDKL